MSHSVGFDEETFWGVLGWSTVDSPAMGKRAELKRATSDDSDVVVVSTTHNFRPPAPQ